MNFVQIKSTQADKTTAAGIDKYFPLIPAGTG
jgi:hypothetical protein